MEITAENITVYFWEGQLVSLDLYVIYPNVLKIMVIFIYESTVHLPYIIYGLKLMQDYMVQDQLISKVCTVRIFQYSLAIFLPSYTLFLSNYYI